MKGRKNLTTTSEIVDATKFQDEERIAYARERNLAFARYTMPKFQDTQFHKNYLETQIAQAREQILESIDDLVKSKKQ